MHWMSFLAGVASVYAVWGVVLAVMILKAKDSLD